MSRYVSAPCQPCLSGTCTTHQAMGEPLSPGQMSFVILALWSLPFVAVGYGIYKFATKKKKRK